MFARTCLTLLLMLGTSLAGAQSVTVEAITQADNRNDTAALETMRDELDATAGYDEAYATAYLQYRLAGAYIGNQQTDQVAMAAKASAEAAQLALEHSPDSPEALALLAAGLGMQISAEPLKGMWLGRRADRAIDRALELAPENLRVRLIKGISLLNKPPLFGGSAEKAIAELTRAIQLAQTAGGTSGWGTADAYIWRGLARLEADDESAAEDFANALSVTPDHAWANHLLDRYAAKAAAGS